MYTNQVTHNRFYIIFYANIQNQPQQVFFLAYTKPKCHIIKSNYKNKQQLRSLKLYCAH